LNAIEKETGKLDGQVQAIFSAHSHYDHLMDVPAIFQRFQKKPTVFLSKSGYVICKNVIDTTYMVTLDNHVSTQNCALDPIVLSTKNGKKINVYPILSEHNPHKNNIKFFSGTVTRTPTYFKNAYDKTRSNDWLEGSIYSFLIDYLDENGAIELRLFIQSSSCNPPNGFPPVTLLQKKKIDIAFLGVASYSASPDYPKELLKIISPQKIVWVHWEDFFQAYNKKTKAVRGTDEVAFFEKVMPTSGYVHEWFTPFPRVKIEIKY